MGKTNFSKVEKALEEGMIRLKSETLLKEADALKGTVQLPDKLPPKEVCNTMLASLERDLKKLRKEDQVFYKKLVFHKVDLKKLITNPSLLTPEDWKTIKEIKERVEIHKKELAAKLPIESDQDIVEHERKAHLNKRLNVSNKKWIPLDRLPE